MTRVDRDALAYWLSRFKGAEIIQDWVLDELASFGVRFSKIESALIYGSSHVAIPTLTREDVYARFGKIPDTQVHATPGRWRGVLVVDVAFTLCHLAGIPGDPAHGQRGTASRFAAYINALREEERHAERNSEQEA